MPEQHRHLTNKCEDIVNLQGAGAYCVAARAQLVFLNFSFLALGIGDAWGTIVVIIIMQSLMRVNVGDAALWAPLFPGPVLAKAWTDLCEPWIERMIGYVGSVPRTRLSG